MSPRTALCLFATLFIFSCTGAPRVRPDRVPLAELPDSYQELWTAWLEEAPDWGERREEGSAFALYRVGQEALQALTGTTGRPRFGSGIGLGRLCAKRPGTRGTDDSW